jgi:hypothetical protein
MLIKSRMGISADGFVSTPEGVPAIAIATGFESGDSHGHPELRVDRTFPDGSAGLVYMPA